MSQPFVPGYGPALQSGGGFTGIVVMKNGLSQGTFTAIDFIGAGVAVAPNGAKADVTIPGGGGGGVTVQDSLGNQVNGTTTITFSLGEVTPGAPGEAVVQGGIEVLSNDVPLPGGFSKLNFYSAVFVADAGSGQANIALLTPPVNPTDDGRAAYADSGDLAYTGLFTLDGVPTFRNPGNPYVYDNAVGFAVIQFDPPIAPPGPPFFGGGNGFVHIAQHAHPASGLSGGDAGIQAGNSAPGASGGYAFVRAGAGTIASDNGEAQLRNAAGSALLSVGGANNGISFFGGVPEAQATVTGSRGGNAALASLLTALADYGLIVDGTTP